MAYRFKHDDRTVQDGLRRIAIEHFDSAICEIGDNELGMAETVHQVRARCKRLRGLIRLVRPVFDDYNAENTAIRDAADALSYARDAGAAIETYDALLNAYRDRVERPAFASIRRRLTRRQRTIVRRQDIDDKLAQLRERLYEARDRAGEWSIEGDGFDAVAGGLRKVYRRAQKTMALARKEPSDTAFHEWRKSVKYHWCHARLLSPIWPEPMKAHIAAASHLSELLGSHHDLAVFGHTLTTASRPFGRPADLKVMLGLIDRRKAELEAEAFGLGDRLLAEPASALTQRWRDYWTVWREEGPDRDVVLAA